MDRVHTHFYAGMYKDMYAYIYIYIYIYIFYIYIYTHTHIDIRMYIHTHAFWSVYSVVFSMCMNRIPVGLSRVFRGVQALGFRVFRAFGCLIWQGSEGLMGSSLGPG